MWTVWLEGVATASKLKKASMFTLPNVKEERRRKEEDDKKGNGNRNIKKKKQELLRIDIDGYKSSSRLEMKNRRRRVLVGLGVKFNRNTEFT